MSARPLSLPAISVTFRIGDGADVTVTTYDDRAPFLNFITDTIGTEVTVTNSHASNNPDADLAFARALAKAAPRYLEAMEAHVTRVRSGSGGAS